MESKENKQESDMAYGYITKLHKKELSNAKEVY
jgi:hypothetical protein